MLAPDPSRGAGAGGIRGSVTSVLRFHLELASQAQPSRMTSPPQPPPPPPDSRARSRSPLAEIAHSRRHQRVSTSSPEVLGERERTPPRPREAPAGF
eukprot:12032707-Alexandrium_andersonii.AAC.1